LFGWGDFKGNEKEEDKSREKMVYVGVWLERKEEGKLVRLGCFLLRSTKILSLQFGKKIEERKIVVVK